MHAPVLPLTRWASWIIVAILIPALVVLWGLPGRTADLWAWPIEPDMTAIFMGSGYGAGAYFFARAATARQWPAVSVGVLSAAAFAALMLVVTLVHFDRFNQGDAPVLAALAFYGWVGVYVVSPVAVGWIWWRNTRAAAAEGGGAGAGPVVPRAARRAARLVGAGALGAAAVVLAVPGVAVDAGPWSLTPLTARVIACFTAQVGIGALLLSRDERWDAWRVLLQTVLVASALLAAGVARAWEDLLLDRPAAWLFLAGLAALATAVAGLYAAMARTERSRPGPRAPEAGPGRLTASRPP